MIGESSIRRFDTQARRDRACLREAYMRGWWAHPETGAVHVVSDHATEVAMAPERYGLAKDDVRRATGGKEFNQYDTSLEGSRGQLIQAAARKGWVRVRNFGNSTSVQLHGKAATRLRSLVPHLAGMGAAVPYTKINASDFATGWQRTYANAEEMETDIRAGNVPDQEGREALGREAAASLGKLAVRHGVPGAVPEPQQRQILRQRLGQRSGIPDRDIEEKTKRSKP